MAFEMPTLDQLLARAQADSSRFLPEVDARLRRSVERVLASVSAGASWSLHEHLNWVSRQIMPRTADKEGLLRWMNLFLSGPRAPSKASGAVLFRGSDGATVDAGTRLQRNDGVLYVVTTTATVVGDQVTLQVQAEAMGASGNADPGTRIALLSPVTGIVPAGEVGADGLHGGADEESREAMLQRLEHRIQNPARAGAAGDYEAWAREVPTVTRAWEYSGGYGPGTVTLAFAVDEDGTIPSVTKVEEVQAHLDAVRPVTAEVVVFAPVAHPITFEFAGLSPDTPAIRSGIKASVADLFLLEARPGGSLPLAWIRAAISEGRPTLDYELMSPAASIVAAQGHLPVITGWNWGDE